MCQEMDLSTFFDLSFLSFQMGCVKPHPDIFQKVIKALRVPPAKILYFDDNLINVEAAKAAGIQGVHTKGFSEVQTYLTQALDL